MKKIPVTLRALLQRINRVLAKEDQRLYTRRTARDGSHPRGWNDTGSHYIVDLRRNLVIGTHVDPELYGREIGVLESYEALAE